MIDCKACGFVVNPAMRHSLVRNCCPSCGGALFGDMHKRRLDLFKQRLSGQEFAQALSDSLIFDIALFMLTEFCPTEDKTEDKPDSLIEEGEAAAENEGPQSDVEEDSYEKIRDAVRSEIMSDLDPENIDSDLDMKVARLKRIAKEKPIRNTGPAVRRVTGD